MGSGERDQVLYQSNSGQLATEQVVGAQRCTCVACQDAIRELSRIEDSWASDTIKEYRKIEHQKKLDILVETAQNYYNKDKPSDRQIGGDHYKDFVIQPSEFNHKNDIGFLAGNVIKYVCRYKAKGGKIDLEKARHYIDLLLEWEYDEDIDRSGT